MYTYLTTIYGYVPTTLNDTNNTNAAKNKWIDSTVLVVMPVIDH